MPLVTIDPQRCEKDGLCVRICQKVFSQPAEGSVPIVAHEGSCNSCGHCVMICPSGAISQRDCPPESLHAVRKDILPSYEQVREMIVTRRSMRSFQHRSVAKEVIEKVIEAAQYAPSAKNTRSTEVIIVQDKTLLKTIASTTAQWLGKTSAKLKNPVLRKLYLLQGAARDADEVRRWIEQFDFIAEKGRENTDLILFDAPVLLLFHADKRVRFAGENANLALQNATMAVCSLGLGSFYTGYVVTACGHDRTIPRLVNLPDRHRIYGGMALGYPDIHFPKRIERGPAKVTWI